MRDSINYNLKYFIMKMSGTKPMKNTMRKSPIKQGFMDTQNPAMKTAKKITDAVRAVKLKKDAAKKAESTKTEGTKTATKPTVQVKIKTPPTTVSKETKKAAATAAMDKTAKPTLMQMKKRKC